MIRKTKSWCTRDDHHLYELFEDFNEWLDSEEGITVREINHIENLSQPSKAFYASDKEAYDESFKLYRQNRYHEVLSKNYLCEQFTDDHWYERNVTRFDQLVSEIVQGNVVPFIGAGLSVSGGFPTWEEHLKQQGRTAGIDETRIESWLSEGQYEEVIEEIEKSRGKDVFSQEIRDVFGKTGEITQTTWLVTELFTDTILTTNYDRLLEQAFDTGADTLQIISGTNASEKPISGKVSVIKLHGDIKKPATCILSKSQYDEAYGKDESIDMSLNIPKLLEYYYKNSSLLFLGSSLNSDRTVQVFRTIKDRLGDINIPQHFSIEMTPETELELVERNAYLSQLGITAIWFERNCYEYVENILRLARNEVRYKGISHKEILPVVDSKKSCYLDLELAPFLNDFIDVMPLMHWSHKHIPQKETKKYLEVMQRIFNGSSFFTQETNKDLLIALDNLLRALSTSSNFDDYAQGKLLTAFNCFQKYFKSIDESTHPKQQSGWTIHELLTIPLGQLEEVDLAKNEDYRLIRIAIVLFKHGLKQQHHPKQYAQLPAPLSAEMSEYLSMVFKSKLGLKFPDRLNQSVTDEINSLCAYSWYQVDKLKEASFLGRVLRCFGLAR